MKQLFGIFFLIMMSVVSLFSKQIDNTVNSVDCIVLKDENSIICKYIHQRVDYDKKIIMQWIDPNNHISRERTMIIPQGHTSIYDYRYSYGRIKGKWIVKVIDNSKEYTTTFTLE